MPSELPLGFLLRPAALTDLNAVADLVVACDIADTGQPDFSCDELLVDWRRGGFVVDTDAWVVCSPQGKMVGYGDVWDDGKLCRMNPNTCVHPEYRGLGIGRALLRRAEEWANRSRAAPGSRGPAILNQYVGHTNSAALVLMESEGYRPVRYHWSMQINMEVEPSPPSYPTGLIARNFIPDQDDRIAHRAIQDAFEDIWGHEPHSFEDWELFIPKRVGFDPRASFLAFDGPEIAGAVMSFDYAPRGWIRQLGVRRNWRRRGLAFALLHEVFGEYYRRGCRQVGLVVDSESLTGATLLYQRAGMHVVRQFDQFQKHLDPARP